MAVRQLYEELGQYRQKERKAKWYQRTKGKGKKRMASSSSLSSDSSTVASTSSSAIVDMTSGSDNEIQNETDFFPQSDSRNVAEPSYGTNETKSLPQTDNRDELCIEDGTSTTNESVFQEGLPVTQQT